MLSTKPEKMTVMIMLGVGSQPDDDSWTEHTVQQESIAMMDRFGGLQQQNSHRLGAQLNANNDDNSYTECAVQEDKKHWLSRTINTSSTTTTTTIMIVILNIGNR